MESIPPVDNATNATVGTVQTSVTLTVLPPCTFAASASTLTFTATVGNNPTTPTQSFTISATGTCAGSVTITPSGDPGSSTWLAVSGPIAIASGGTATFTVTITSSTLVAGPYRGTITLAAADGNGAIAGGQRRV